MSVFRIRRLTGKEVVDRPSNYHSSYRFLRDDLPLYQCHVYQSCMKPSEFTAAEGSGAPGFTLKPARKLMPFVWLVIDQQSGCPLGSLQRKLFGKVDWRIRDAQLRQVGLFKGVYTPAFFLLRLIDVLVGGNVPDSYQILAHDRCVATMERESGPDQQNEKKAGFRKLLSRVLVDKDWVIRETEGQSDRIDQRLLFAGVVLLEHVSRDLSNT